MKINPAPSANSPCGQLVRVLRETPQGSRYWGWDEGEPVMNNYPDDMNQAQFEAYWSEIRPYLHEAEEDTTPEIEEFEQ